MADSKRMTPEERLEKITKKRTKLAEEEAKIRAALRKKEDNLKHELGGLVLKAGLRGESKNVILGILVSGFQVLEKSRSVFEDLGRKKFDLDEKARARKKAAMADGPNKEKDEVVGLDGRDPKMERMWTEEVKKW